MGDDEPQQNNEANEALYQQIEDNKIEIAKKTRSLFDTRLGIIKSEGAQDWVGSQTKPPM